MPKLYDYFYCVLCYDKILTFDRQTIISLSLRASEYLGQIKVPSGRYRDVHRIGMDMCMYIWMDGWTSQKQYASDSCCHQRGGIKTIYTL